MPQKILKINKLIKESDAFSSAIVIHLLLIISYILVHLTSRALSAVPVKLPSHTVPTKPQYLSLFWQIYGALPVNKFNLKANIVKSPIAKSIEPTILFSTSKNTMQPQLMAIPARTAEQKSFNSFFIYFTSEVDLCHT